ncbi:MAG: DEAD/DEAH box helicase [Rubripirellula sp.]
MNLLAHSSPRDRPSESPQPYREHIAAAREGACERARRMLKFSREDNALLHDVIRCASHWHDLGKLDDGNQQALSLGRKKRLPIDHIDAGVAHTWNFSAMVAWLIRAHHAPGLPCNAQEDPEVREKPLRGTRHRDASRFAHQQLIEHVDGQLAQLVDRHVTVCEDDVLRSDRIQHGLRMRLALSCLVDADHSDSADYDRGVSLTDPSKPRWRERLTALDNYVEGLANNAKEGTSSDRIALRQEFYWQCRNTVVDGSLASCTGPVGIGKTTAVLACLINTALRTSPTLDRIIVVAPYTNIIDQTVNRIREAVVLPGERAEDVVAAHHHQVEYASLESRAFATQWNAPIVVTTAVQFFGTLAENNPAALRKLHALPGSAVFLDEAHAAIPVRLWPQNLRWIRELSRDWQCRFVFASGSLIEFWKLKKIVLDEPMKEISPIAQAVVEKANEVEQMRVTYTMEPEALARQQLVEKVLESDKPSLVILNTVQSAAIIARDLRAAGENVLHLSTALCPTDRQSIVEKITQRLESKRDEEWILVATSCVEAGVDLSFKTAFRQASSVTSVIQIGGRVNRHGERASGIVISFHLIKDDYINEHPDFKVSANVLQKMFESGDFEDLSPDKLATKAMKLELKQLGDAGGEQLIKAERSFDYPLVAKLGRVIDTDTRTVVVSQELIGKLDKGERPTFQELQSGSVQLWSPKINELALETAKTFPNVYVWRDRYDQEFLGIMDGILRTCEFQADGGGVI